MKPLSLIFFFAILLGLRMQGVSQNIFHNGLIIKESGDTLKGYLKLQGNKMPQRASCSKKLTNPSKLHLLLKILNR
jgi:hypothetical protein